MESFWIVALLIGMLVFFGGLVAFAFHPANRYSPTGEERHRRSKYPPFYL